MAKNNPILIGIALVAVVFLVVYLSVEGFYAYTSYSDYLRAKYGLSTKKTASMSASELKFRREWDAHYVSGSQQKLYDLVRKSGTLDPIRRLLASIFL